MNKDFKNKEINKKTTPSTALDLGILTSASNKKKKKEKIVETGTKSLALVGAIALLAIIIWGGTQVARSLPEDFSKTISNTLLAAVSTVTSIFVSNEEENPITFNVTTHSIEAKTPFTLDWRHKTNLYGNYFFHYECALGLKIERVNTDGVNSEISCDSPLNLFEEKAVTFEITQTKERFVDIPITVSFIPQNAGVATTQASTVITVTNTDPAIEEVPNTGESVESGTQRVTAGAEENETQVVSLNGGNTPNVQPSNPLGTPDLAVSIIATGVIDVTTNDFSAFATVESNQRAAIRFKIENVGTKTTGPWTFIVDLPIASGKLYVYRPADKQRSLNPGERIEYTLGFDSISRTSPTVGVTINVDTVGEVPETNRENNVGTAVISVQTI